MSLFDFKPGVDCTIRVLPENPEITRSTNIWLIPKSAPKREASSLRCILGEPTHQRVPVRVYDRSRPLFPKEKYPNEEERQYLIEKYGEWYYDDRAMTMSNAMLEKIQKAMSE